MRFGADKAHAGAFERCPALRIGLQACGDVERHAIDARDEFRGLRQPDLPVEHDARRRTVLQPRETDRQRRVVFQRRSDANQNGVGLGPHQIDLAACDIACYRDLAGASPADLAITGKRKLQNHFRALAERPNEIAGHLLGGLPGQHLLHHFDAGGAQDGVALAGDARIRIAGRTHDARNAGIDQRVGARRGATMMGAGLKVT